MTFTVVGTSGYTPLEQFWGRAVPASDLYALGATLIHLLTGVAPADLPQSNLRIQFANRNLSPNFVSWIEKLTAPALEQRFSNAHQALAALKLQVSSGDSSQTGYPHTIKSIPGYGTCVVVEKSIVKLEISRQPAATDSAAVPLGLIFYLVFLIVRGGEALVALFTLAITLILLIWILSLLLNFINNQLRGELKGCFVRFDADNNNFEFSSRISAFNTSWGLGELSSIKNNLKMLIQVIA